MLGLQCWDKLQVRSKGIKFAYQAPDNPGKGLKAGGVTLEGKGEGLELQVLCRGLVEDGEGGEARGQEGGRGDGVGQQQPVLEQQRQQAGRGRGAGEEGKAVNLFILTQTGQNRGFMEAQMGLGWKRS